MSQERQKLRLASLVDCPGCRQTKFHATSLFNHMQRCCPDLLHDKALWANTLRREPPDLPAVRRLLLAAGVREAELRQRTLQLAFRSTDALGAPVRRGPAELAASLGLPEVRCERLLRLAIKDTPLPGDPEAIDVVYEDEWLVAVNKPPALNSQPVHRHVGGSVVNRLITLLGYPPHVLHRLDMDTSGLMILAKRASIVADIHAQFRRRLVHKQYIAAALGAPPHAAFTVNAPLAPHGHVATAMRVAAEGKPSQTDVRVLSVSHTAVPWDRVGEVRTQADLSQMKGVMGACLVCCEPRTGRTHQIRVHLAEAGHPLLGDGLYGVRGPGMQRQALHAWRLQFRHPGLDREMTLEAPLPSDMVALVHACGLTMPDGSSDMR